MKDVICQMASLWSVSWCSFSKCVTFSLGGMRALGEFGSLTMKKKMWGSLNDYGAEVKFGSFGGSLKLVSDDPFSQLW